jgi:hypothetical protein
MELITDLRAIRKEIGLRLEERTLYPRLNLDAYKDVTPMLIKKGEKIISCWSKKWRPGALPGGLCRAGDSKA